MLTSDQVLKVVSTVLDQNLILGDLLDAQEKSYIVKNSVVRAVQPGVVLCPENQIGTTVYLLISGEAKVTSHTDGKTLEFGKRVRGDLVGEISMLFLMPRIASVTMTAPGVVLEIPSHVLSSVIDSNPYARDALMRRCMDRVVATALRRVPIFHGLDSQSFQELCDSAILKRYRKGEIVTREGATERSMFVVCRGNVRVFITINGEEVTVDTRNPGDYFGEYSLFTGEPRTASVSAATDLQLVVLEGQAFQAFLDSNVELENLIGREVWQRKQSLTTPRDETVIRQLTVDRMVEIQSLLDGE